MKKCKVFTEKCYEHPKCMATLEDKLKVFNKIKRPSWMGKGTQWSIKDIKALDKFIKDGNNDFSPKNAKGYYQNFA
jgi:hypothetical protein